MTRAGRTTGEERRLLIGGSCYSAFMTASGASEHLARFALNVT